jgi:membrane protein DedA with SNARE-associated domain
VGGVLASQHVVSLPVLFAVVVAAAIVGDSVGFEVGRRFGDRLLGHRAVRKHQTKVDKAHGLLHRHGAIAVFIGRFTALLRALMPALAGSAKMPYGRFLTFNALGGLVWGIGFTTGGYVAGTAFEHIAKWLGRGIGIAVAVFAITALVVWAVRRRRAEAADETAADLVPTPGDGHQG